MWLVVLNLAFPLAIFPPEFLIPKLLIFFSSVALTFLFVAEKIRA
jgi:hypothetical protein